MSESGDHTAGRTDQETRGRQDAKGERNHRQPGRGEERKERQQGDRPERGGGSASVTSDKSQERTMIERKIIMIIMAMIFGNQSSSFLFLLLSLGIKVPLLVLLLGNQSSSSI